jgi:MFS family permease
MGLSTLLVGLLPTYAQAGWWAPLILCVLRFGQGFGLGGEWGGAALLAVENAPAGYRARFGSVPQLGAPVGFILANGLFLILGLALTTEQFRDWGWRIPFLLSAVLVGLGLWIRLKLAETAQFAAALREAPPPAVPFGTVLARHGGALVGGTFGTIACFVLYYLATAFALGYGTKTLGYPANRFLLVQLGAILFMALTIWVSGVLADRRYDERRMLMAGCVVAIATGCLIQPLMGSGSLFLVFVFLSLCMLAMGFCYGPLGGWLPTLFPPLVRYTGVSAAFNLASILGGGLTPIVAQYLATRHGLVPVGLYCSGLAAVSLVALVVMGRRGATG